MATNNQSCLIHIITHLVMVLLEHIIQNKTADVNQFSKWYHRGYF